MNRRLSLADFPYCTRTEKRIEHGIFGFRASKDRRFDEA